MDNSQEPKQQLPESISEQILQRHYNDDTLDLIEPKPSKAQVNMAPIIEKIFNEVKAMRESDTASNWENLEALGTSLEAIDVDSFNPRAYRDAAVLEKTRPAKLRIIEMLYDYAKEMSKRELANLLLHLTALTGEMEENLLDGDMGEGYWTNSWIDHESLLFGLGSYDEVRDGEYKDSDDEENDQNNNDPDHGREDKMARWETHNMMVDEGMKE